MVCPLAADKVIGKSTMIVAKDLPSTKAAEAKKFNEEVKEITKGIQGVEIDVKAQFGAGDQYDTITGVVPINGGDPINLEHKEGEVWLIDFWATWCPPCQAPMAHNQEMLTKRKADWGDKLRIIGISIDQTAEPVVKHVEAKGWADVEHYHRAGSSCSNQYGIKGVPHVILVDTKGKIVYKGHPAQRKDLEADFDTLLKGEAITGEGTAPAEGAGDSAEADPGFSALDFAAVNKEVDDFEEVGKALQQDPKVQEAAKTLMRAFCVYLLREKFNPFTGDTTGKFENYRVLVGPSASIDAIKPILEEKVKGSFQVVMQEHPMG
uniref:Thioredoxin domain-containing protein n=1 Tax=Strombidium inclinatum TaxID=197538 RepID=A0A7S3IZY9_9SPIT